MRIKSKWAFKAGQNLKQPREGNIATFHVPMFHVPITETFTFPHYKIASQVSIMFHVLVPSWKLETWWLRAKY